jgi:hypothetical protein
LLPYATTTNPAGRPERVEKNERQRRIEKGERKEGCEE